MADWSLITNQPGVGGAGGNAFAEIMDRQQQRDMQRQQMQEQRRQFDLNYGLHRDQFANQQRQFDQTFGLQKDQFGLQQNQDRRAEASAGREQTDWDRKNIEVGANMLAGVHGIISAAQTPEDRRAALDMALRLKMIDQNQHAQFSTPDGWRFMMERVNRAKQSIDAEMTKHRAEADQAQAKADQMHPGYAVRAAKQSIDEARRNGVTITPEQERDILTRAAQPKPEVKILKDGETPYVTDGNGGVKYLPTPENGGQSKAYREAYDKEQGTERSKAALALPGIEASSQRALQTIEQIRTHPGRWWGTGRTGSVPTVPGSDARGFANLVDQAKGQTFLEAFNALRGGGAITEIEGQKATQAIARLDRAQSPADFEAALKDLQEVIATGLNVARSRSNPQAVAQPKTPQAPAQSQEYVYNPATGKVEPKR